MRSLLEPVCVAAPGRERGTNALAQRIRTATEIGRPNPLGAGQRPKDVEEQLDALRPKLHRYCARMTGSVIDGEDVVQDAFVKALAAYQHAGPIANLESWLFRIAHNAALDFLRRRARLEAAHASEDPAMLPDPLTPLDDPDIVAASLGTFMRLPAGQRSSVILMDVLGYPLAEICGIMETSLPAVKSALHRGRTRLRELALEPEDRVAPVLGEAERTLLAAYIDRFNARDFDTVRQMLAEEVRLDLVNRLHGSGRKDVSTYYTRYDSNPDWQCALGLVDGRLAILIAEPAGTPFAASYFVLVAWDAGRVAAIRDFRYARYAIAEADVVIL